MESCKGTDEVEIQSNLVLTTHFWHIQVKLMCINYSS